MGFADRKQQATREGTSLTRDMPLFRDMPGLYECLVGTSGPRGQQLAMCKLSIWVDGSSVKVCVNDEANSMNGFGVLDVNTPFAGSVENLLSEGDIEWKPKKDQRR